MSHRGAIVGLVLVVALGGVAAADEGAAAKRFFLSGSKHFDLGEYTDALHDFKEGYRLKDDPVFLYNIAQCHRLLNQNTDALRAYRTYLRRAPTAPNREEVERKIAAIERAQAAATAATTTPPNHVLAPEGRTPGDTTPPTTTTATTPEPATTPPSNAVTTQAPARERQPIYKKWWLWTAVGVVAVGVGVGLGVGLSSSSTHFPSATPSDGTIRF